MGRVLLGWELGDGSGQSGLIAELARGLAADGIEIVVASPDIVRTRLALHDIPARILQAPRWPHHQHLGSELGQEGYLDLLATIGFGDPAKIGAVAEAWRSLIDLAAPDLIVAGHVPGLLVATYGRGIPVVAVGSALTMPPLSGDRLPPLRADRGAIIPEARLLAAAGETLARRSVALPRRLVDLLVTDERFVFGLPELDPYGAFRKDVLYVPHGGLPTFVEPPISPHLFVSLGEDVPHLEVLAKVLADDEISASAYLDGDAGFIPYFLSRRGHMVHRSPPLLTETLPAASHVLFAGEMFTAVAALASGRPQLVMPLHDEAQVVFNMLDQLGVARKIAPSPEPELLRRSLHAFLQDHAIARKARHWAKVIADRPAPGADVVVAALRARLGA